MDGGNGFFLMRIGAAFAAALGLMGLVLATVGVYGVVSYAASQRTQEIGIRVALGAKPRDIGRLVVGQGFVPVVMGLVAGLAAAAALGRLIANLLFGISPTDPMTFVSVPLNPSGDRDGRVLRPGAQRHARGPDRRAQAGLKALPDFRQHTVGGADRGSPSRL